MHVIKTSIVNFSLSARRVQPTVAIVARLRANLPSSVYVGARSSYVGTAMTVSQADSAACGTANMMMSYCT